jgi:uroporphyrinogen-III synthase
VLFPSAKGSLQTIKKQLTEDTEAIDLPIYETIALENVSKSNAEVLIFTSPSNAKAYFANNLIAPSQKVISIGYSTAEVLKELGIDYSLPYSPDEVGLSEAVFGLS